MTIKKIASLSMATLLIFLVACGQPAEVKNVKAMSLEEIAIKSNQTLEEQEEYIYSFISDRVKVDTSLLSKADEKAVAGIKGIMAEVTGKLQGLETDIISDTTANYLLMEMSKVPYSWSMSNIKILGYDPATRYYFVDVDFSTTKKRKEEIPKSIIPYGIKDEEELLSKRYSEYMRYIDALARNNSKAETFKMSFEETWGNIDEILKSQQGTTLLDRNRESAMYETTNISNVGYSGALTNGITNPGTMTVRFVLSYVFNIGTESGMQVKSVYLTDYNLSDLDATLQKFTTETVLNSELLEPIIQRNLVAYHRGIEETDHKCLSSLFMDYSDYDKMYEDMSSYAYFKFLSFDSKIIGVIGDKVYVSVDRVKKSRAIGSNTSFPVYKEKLIFEMQIAQNDRIGILNETLLSSVIIGEPLSVIRGVTGVSEKLLFAESSFTASNKNNVEKLIKTFSDYEINSTAEDIRYMPTVDLAISSTKMAKLKDSIAKVVAEEKYVWFAGYETTSNMYCKVSVRELYRIGEQYFEVSSVYETINTNNEWKIIGVERRSITNIKDLGTIDLTTAVYKSTRGSEVGVAIVPPEVVNGETTSVPADAVVTLAPEVSKVPQRSEEVTEIPVEGEEVEGAESGDTTDVATTTTSVSSGAGSGIG